jgi:hypothetical protein
VRIERAADGTASVTLQAEKPDTLRALQQDAAHLHQALDRAGLPSEGRQVTYELATGLSVAGGQGSAGAGLSNGSLPNGSGGSANQNGQSGRGAPATSFAAADPAPNPDQPRAATWRAAGLNITA